jgi:ubiquinone/menaquinone biosynthesis C-methylase UbiE
MKNFKETAPSGFDNPTVLPSSEKQAVEWQEQNYAWWQNNPMCYNWATPIPYPESSREFFKEVDDRFFGNSREYLVAKDGTPFAEFVDFAWLQNADVLEIGVGLGSHAQLLASHAKSFNGVDITDYAVKNVTERMRIFNVRATICKMDAEHLQFTDNSFDFVWSWGVIHHSANTEHVLQEIRRVLRPGGKAVIMVYHRGWWNYYVTELLRGILSGTIFKFKSLNASIQVHTDGALARYYTTNEWKALAQKYFSVKRALVRGPKSDVVLLPGGSFKGICMRLLPNRINVFLTEKLKMGVFLISVIEKEG